tara:strand:- start:3 stop:2627 length:2625 start_codon:yes stop_codon:yes gene_type:complete
MFEKIKSLFKNKTEIIKNKREDLLYTSKKEYYNLVSDIIKEIKSDGTGSSYFSTYGVKFSELKSYKVIKSKEVNFKKEFALWMLKDITRIYRRNGNNHSYNLKYEGDIFSCLEALIPLLFRSNLNFSDTEYILCLNYFKDNILGYRGFSFWPVGFLIQQLERKVKKEGLSEPLKTFLREVLLWNEIKDKESYYGTDIGKVRNRIQAILVEHSTDKQIIPFKFITDEYGIFSNTVLETQKTDIKNVLYQLLHLSIKVSGGKPTQKFLKATSILIDELDFTTYKSFVYQLLEEVIKHKPIEKTTNYTHNDYSYDYTHYEFIEKSNLNTLKGLVWTLSKFHDAKTIILLSKLAERCYKKIPGVGPTAAALGNACLYTLANTKGKDGIAQLTVLKQKIKQTSTKKLIDKYINEISKKLGVSKSDIEESIVSEFGLINGSKAILFDDYKLLISIEKTGKVNVIWEKPDGKTQKTQPSFIKENKVLFDKIKKTKIEIKEIQKFLIAQRNRLDALLIEERVIESENFYKYYLNHGLISFLAKKLIWIVKKDKKEEICFYQDEYWIDINGKQVIWIDETCQFQLWHPIYGSTQQVLGWRNFLINLEIVQPLKQAFREIYVLTEAEINTKIYSNRMASHLIKQHQFNMLAKIRNWNYTLVGAWDHGSDCKARRILKIGNDEFTVEFWLNELFDDGQINDVGMLLYMSTDQVRYLKNGATLDLIDVPDIIFSETMRDVDLFVGVCSVGNDPEWSDNGGLPQYRDYWHSYSFGDLTEVAKTRKTILENLVPRLKIKDVAKVEGKFLIVKGAIRTYKIHLGSTNILMTPNDQYLCIVPSGKKDKTENVYLPFEGDKGMSVILSKAFLLAEDAKITDSTITSQINNL